MNDELEKIIRLDNKIKETVSLSKDISLPGKFKEILSRLKTLSADLLEDISLKIRGRENTHTDIKEIMRNCNLQTKYGDFINPFNLAIKDFRPELFAHSLSRELRFWKQTDLSVAEHSINMANLFPDNQELAQWAMFHEIFEAYTHDLATPFKKALPEYKIAENKALSTFAETLGLAKEMPYEVHLADKRMMITEALKYMPNKEYWLQLGHDMGIKEFGFPLEPYDLSILRDRPFDKNEAELFFAKKWIGLELPTSDLLNEFILENDSSYATNELRIFLNNEKNISQNLEQL